MLAQVLSLYSAPVEPAPTGVFPSSVDAIGIYVEQVKTMEDQGLLRLRQCRDRADIAGVETQYRQTLGEPGREICRLAESWGASLIIVERQHGSLVADCTASSMCNYVLHHAPASVLIV
jgi:nucleotide-binding universal stress UspA family protein